MNSQAYDSFWPHSKRRLVSLPMTLLERDGHFHTKSVSERETMGGTHPETSYVGGDNQMHINQLGGANRGYIQSRERGLGV